MDSKEYIYHFNAEKNLRVKQERGISFEEVIVTIDNGGLLDILEHQNPANYPNQRVFVLEIDQYVWLVPFIQEGRHIFLKTLFPNRKLTKRYLKDSQKNEVDYD